MSLEKILTISGKPGLYQLQNQTRNGFIATSLIDGKKISVSARQNVSILAEIAIYTLTKELPLSEVLTKIFDKEPMKKVKKAKKKEEEIVEQVEDIVEPVEDEDQPPKSDEPEEEETLDVEPDEEEDTLADDAREPWCISSRP